MPRNREQRWAAGMKACGWAVLLGSAISCTKSAPATPVSALASTPEATSGRSEGQTAYDSGIYGSMVAAWGNPPAQPPTYQCVKVFDAAGRKLVATGTCSGTWGQFRVALPPGRYIIEKGGSWTAVAGAVKFVPQRTTITVGTAQWVNLAPRPLPGPVP